MFMPCVCPNPLPLLSPPPPAAQCLKWCDPCYPAHDSPSLPFPHPARGPVAGCARTRTQSLCHSNTKPTPRALMSSEALSGTPIPSVTDMPKALHGRVLVAVM